MTDAAANPPPPAQRRADRLIDAVFARSSPPGRRLLVAGLLAAVVLHAVLWLMAQSAEPSLESWSAEVALRVHTELTSLNVVELFAEPEAEAAASEPAAGPETAPAPPRPAEPRQARRETPRPAANPAPPAQAGAALLQAPSEQEPVDLSGETLVTGEASAYVGGATAAAGTNPTAADPAAVRVAARPLGGRSLQRAVRPGKSEWDCPWPAEAAAQAIYEQAVVLRVVVRSDGSAASAELISDPGNGFGRAAIACALRSKFHPAKDAAGQSIRALSPPIRVRFTR